LDNFLQNVLGVTLSPLEHPSAAYSGFRVCRTGGYEKRQNRHFSTWSAADELAGPPGRIPDKAGANRIPTQWQTLPAA
jgi:hypothetical protein